MELVRFEKASCMWLQQYDTVQGEVSNNECDRTVKKSNSLLAGDKEQAIWEVEYQYHSAVQILEPILYELL